MPGERRQNPVGIQTLGNLRLGRNESEENQVITDMVNRALSVDQGRGSWITRRIALSKLRMGFRKPKDFPWKNASNLSVPLGDNLIRKQKPNYIRLLTEPDPVVTFDGKDIEAEGAERKAEAVYHDLWINKMDALEPMAYLVDGMLDVGYFFLEGYWEYQTEYQVRVVPVREIFPNPDQIDDAQIAQTLIKRYQLYPDDRRVQQSVARAIVGIRNGLEFVKIAFKKVIHDRPAICELHPIQVIHPPRMTDIGNAEWIVTQYMLPVRTIMQREADGFFAQGSVAKIVADMRTAATMTGSKKTSELDSNMASSLYQDRAYQDERERIWGVEDENNILVWRVHHWFDQDGDGLVDRTITWLHPRSKTKLACQPFYFPFPHWPLIQFRHEYTNRRISSSRGIPEMTKDLQIATNNIHNARMDGMALRNAPSYQISVLAGFKARNFRVMPGTVIQTPAGAALQPLMQDRGAFPEQVTEENLIRSLAEQYIGAFDSAITSPSSNTRARTATEIQAIVQYVASTATLDATMFQNVGMIKVHRMVWELYMQFGPEEILVKIMDPDDKQAVGPMLKKITKEEINKSFELKPSGSVLNTNRAIEIANARELLTFFINDQSGFINQRELRKYFLQLITKWWHRILNTPAAAAAEVTLRQAAQAITEEPELMASMKSGRSFEPPPEPGQQEFANSAQYGRNNGF